jgi:hypothetical protein
MNSIPATDRAPNGAMQRRAWVLFALAALSFAPITAGCWNADTPYTNVDLENKYPTSAMTPLVIYRAAFKEVAFQTPLPPGSSSGPQPTVPASDNPAYVVLAPGWDPTSSSAPTSFVVMQSRNGLAVRLGTTLDIPVDDTTFEGNCAAGSVIAQAQADFLTQIVFQDTFAGLKYDATTCTTTLVGDGGGE